MHCSNSIRTTPSFEVSCSYFVILAIVAIEDVSNYIICVFIYIMQKYLIYFVLIQIFYISPISVALPCWNMRYIP